LSEILTGGLSLSLQSLSLSMGLLRLRARSLGPSWRIHKQMRPW